MLTQNEIKSAAGFIEEIALGYTPSQKLTDEESLDIFQELFKGLAIGAGGVVLVLGVIATIMFL